MNGVHDLGGMHGFGAIVREADESPFHAAWEARVNALARSLFEDRVITLDAFRYGIERMAPAHYLQSSYFARWLASIEYNLIQEGILAGDELDARTEFMRQHSAASPPSGSRRVRSAPAPDNLASPAPPPPLPRFAVGEAVVARNVHPSGHTRLPRYARGKQGIVHRLHGPQILPDTNAHGLGEHPEPVYAVRFDAHELWGESAEPGETVSLDLWESYLEPVSR